MSIKIIDSLPKPMVNERLEALKKDIREIIENTIKLCEIIDPPYPQSSMREHLRKAIRSVVWEYAVKDKEHYTPDPYDVFKIQSHKKDGIIHWYIQFDSELWNNERSKLKKKNKERKEEWD